MGKERSPGEAWTESENTKTVASWAERQAGAWNKEAASRPASNWGQEYGGEELASSRLLRAEGKTELKKSLTMTRFYDCEAFTNEG